MPPALSLLLLAGTATLADLGPLPAGTLRVVLVRHGQAFTNLDPPPSPAPANPDALTPLGREQARRAAAALARLRPRLVLSSPAGRAQQTAEIVQKVGGGDVQVDPRVRPLEMGRGPDGRELSLDARIAEWRAGRDPSPPGGESLEDVGKRVLALVEELRAAGTGRTVVLVCHTEVIAAFVGHLEGQPGAARYPPRVPNGSLTVVDARGPGDVAVRLSSLVPEASPAPRAP
jgi:broad specificity phosphatase PhoE